MYCINKKIFSEMDTVMIGKNNTKVRIVILFENISRMGIFIYILTNVCYKSIQFTFYLFSLKMK